MRSWCLLALAAAAVVAVPAKDKAAPAKLEAKPAAPNNADLNLYKECKGTGDPHYISFDGSDMDAVTGNRLARAHGTFLMAGTCGSLNASPITVWITTIAEGWASRVKVRTKKGGAKHSFTLANRDFASCIVAGDDYDEAEFHECQMEAANYGLTLIWNANAVTVMSVGEWKLVAYADGNTFSSVNLFVRSDLYKDHVRGTCGTMDGNRADDGYCWTPGYHPMSCWNQAYLTAPEVNWKHGKWPGTCPKLFPPAYLAGEAEGAVELLKTSEAAQSHCRPITEPEGPFKACFSAEERAHYGAACERDETAGEGRGCVALRALKDHCANQLGLKVDMSKTHCAPTA